MSASEFEESLGPWIVAVASVVFDIDVGQRLETVVPEGALTEPEARDVAFHSFPDSMSMELHSRSSIRDSTFWFRIKRQQAAAPEAGGADANGRPDSGGQASTSGREHYHNQRQEYLYGFVLCRQRQDSRLKRGGEQKSLVLLSPHPLSGALSAAALWAGPLYFNQGPAALQSVWEEVLGWDPPVPSARQLLRLASATEIVQVPHLLALPPPTPDGDAEALAEQPMEVAVPPLDSMQPAFADADVYTPLKGILERAWGVWELLVLAEPLMVCAPSPGECSAAVAALISLIGPLPYSADFRPYFTIHDTAFQELSAASAAAAPAPAAGGLPRLLGVTNLYFLKALPAWPNVLAIGARPGGSEAGGEQGRRPPSRLERVVRRRPGGPLSLLSEHREAVWLGYRPLSRPDKGLLERLLPPPPPGGPPDRAARVAAANSAALRKHFAELTHALLAPLDACCSPLPPPPGVGPLTQPPPAHLPPFSRGSFLEGLGRAELPPALLQRFGGKAGCVAFYRRFLESPNFASWFERRRGRAAAWQQAAWARAVAERGLESQLLGTSEPELVEAFAALERRLGAASQAAAAGSPRARLREGALQRQLGACFQRMPRDLQGCMLSSPGRAALLQRLAPGTRVPGLPIAHHGSSEPADASQ